MTSCRLDDVNKLLFSLSCHHQPPLQFSRSAWCWSKSCHFGFDNYAAKWQLVAKKCLLPKLLTLAGEIWRDLEMDIWLAFWWHCLFIVVGSQYSPWMWNKGKGYNRAFGNKRVDRKHKNSVHKVHTLFRPTQQWWNEDDNNLNDFLMIIGIVKIIHYWTWFSKEYWYN